MNRNNIAEKEIKEILKKISYSETLSEQGWLGGELKLPNLEQGWEIAFKYGEQIFVVEYDDDKHYRNTLTIKSDLEKDRIAKELGYNAQQTIKENYNLSRFLDGWNNLFYQTINNYKG